MIKELKCPHCGKIVKTFRNPLPTVDIIIEMGNHKIILIKRKNPPPGWAIPGGFVDYGESLEEAAIREAKEETSLEIELIEQFHTYSDPQRDSRQHNISTVYIASGRGTPRAADDAAELSVFTEDNLPHPLVFDHEKILKDYFNQKQKRQDKQCPVKRDRSI
jgi:ADP-ribose pyrophosphatase YjhB (NUDIX family)